MLSVRETVAQVNVNMVSRKIDFGCCDEMPGQRQHVSKALINQQQSVRHPAGSKRRPTGTAADEMSASGGRARGPCRYIDRPFYRRGSRWLLTAVCR